MIWLIVVGKAIGSKTVFGFTSLQLTSGYRFMTKKGQMYIGKILVLARFVSVFYTLKPTSC